MKRRYFCHQINQWGTDEVGETEGKIIASHFNTDGNTWNVIVEHEIKTETKKWWQFLGKYNKPSWLNEDF